MKIAVQAQPMSEVTDRSLVWNQSERSRTGGTISCISNRPRRRLLTTLFLWLSQFGCLTQFGVWDINQMFAKQPPTESIAKATLYWS